MKKANKYRFYVIITALAVLSVVSLIRPEAAEYVARAFLLLLGAP